MDLREAGPGDLGALLELYAQFRGEEVPAESDGLNALWMRILDCPDRHIILAGENGRVISSCTLIIVPNLTHGQRPYALIENVITHENFRKKGYATAVLNYARDIAMSSRCYKIMLMTGAKDDGTLRFYERAGYNQKDKTAFIQWLD